MGFFGYLFRYPAAHVLIYRALYHLTEQGTNIYRAQAVFTALYMSTLVIVIMSYRRARAPVYALGLLALSKRLHSIYILRLFNDGYAMFFLHAMALSVSYSAWNVGVVLYSIALSVKMNALLWAPGLGTILLRQFDIYKVVQLGMIALQLQVSENLPNSKSYCLDSPL